MATTIAVLVGSLERFVVAVFSPLQALGACAGRTHAQPSNNLPRTIHKLDSANKVVSCAVFFFNPR